MAKTKLESEIMIVTNMFYGRGQFWVEVTGSLLSGGYSTFCVPRYIAEQLKKHHVYSVNVFQETVHDYDPDDCDIVVAELVADLGPYRRWRCMFDTYEILTAAGEHNDDGMLPSSDEDDYGDDNDEVNAQHPDPDNASTLPLPSDYQLTQTIGLSDVETHVPQDYDDMVLTDDDEYGDGPTELVDSPMDGSGSDPDSAKDPK